ncbi:MAG: 1-(5-phosphoribosyl)-5-[(5-phosphoribosylamino)methylideneamino]imidazole-4-carboxamide isomerase [Pseudomonadota bacterium]
MKIIPSIDLRDGRCVRLLYGDYELETRYDADPVELASRYAALGLDTLHVVDLDGARAGAPKNVDLIARMVEATTATVQVGGGIREAAHLTALFDAGARRVVVGSLAIKQPARVAEWLVSFGGERIVLAFDVRVDASGVAHVSTDAWQETSDAELVATVESFRPHGLQQVLCTDIGRDGALSGPATTLYTRVMAACPDIKLQASGGVSSIDDLRALREAGLDAAITGKALLEGRITDEEIQSF